MAEVDHQHQPIFIDDLSVDVGQEQTFTDEQISMINTSRNATNLQSQMTEDNDDEQASLLDMDAYKPLVNQYGLITQFCNQHIANVQPIQAYCCECSQQLCIECILTNEHKGHQIISIQKGHAMCQREFESQYNDIIVPASLNLEKIYE